MVQLVDRVSACTKPSYHLVYLDVIDTISHRYGPNSDHIAAEIRALFRLLEDQVAKQLAKTDTLILLTADHGHIAVDPTQTVYVDDALPSLSDGMATTADGRPLAHRREVREICFCTSCPTAWSRLTMH